MMDSSRPPHSNQVQLGGVALDLVVLGLVLGPWLGLVLAAVFLGITGRDIGRHERDRTADLRRVKAAL